MVTKMVYEYGSEITIVEQEEHYGISRTTLWRWKKQSAEWKKKYGFD